MVSLNLENNFVVMPFVFLNSNLTDRQVALVVDNSWFCGATIISADWILTAAHCTDGGRSFEVILGAHNKNIVESTQVRIIATQFTMHPRWNPARLQNDVALIKLPSPVSFTRKQLNYRL